MRKALVTLAVAAMLVALPALAQTNQQASPTQHKVTGQVVMVTPTQVTVRTDSGQTRDFAITDNTEGRQYLVQGQQVDLWYRQNSDTGKVEVVDVRQSKSSDSSSSNMQGSQSSSSSSSSQSEQGEQSTQGSSTSSSSQSGSNTQGSQSSNNWKSSNQSSSSQSSNMSSTSGKKLPQTASDLPLILVIGMASVAGALGFRFVVRH
jgi:cobalamin biosynthesis Mg chelatase CobN